MIGKYIAKYKWLLVGIITVIIVARRHITINLCPPFVPWFARILENLGFVVIAAIAIFIIFNLIGNFILKLQRREEEYENISNQVKRVNEQMSEKAKVLAQKNRRVSHTSAHSPRHKPDNGCRQNSQCNSRKYL